MAGQLNDAIQREIAAEMRWMTAILGEDIEEGASTLRNAAYEFDATVVAVSLRAATTALAEVHRDVLAGGATSEASAIPGPGGQWFAVDGLGDGARGLAVISAAGRFLHIARPTPDGEESSVVRWQPEPNAALLAELADLPERADDLPPTDLVRAASHLSAFASPGGPLHLATIIEQVAERGRAPREAVLASMVRQAPRRAEVGSILTGSCRGGLESFAAFAGAIRPLIEAKPMAAEEAEYVLRSANLALSALADDGGFCGPTCVGAAQTLRQAIWALRFGKLGDAFAKAGEDVLASGHAWGGQMLVYGDYDRRTFAVQGAEPGVVGRYHRNSDLISDLNSHMVVTTRGADGAVQRVEIHPCHRPPGAIVGQSDWATADLLRERARTAHIYADEEATPPRLTRRMLAERIAQGESLPPPAGGFDYLTGQLLPSTVANPGEAIENAFYGLREDRYAMAQLAELGAEEFGDAMETDFTEDGEEADEDPLPAPAL